MSKPENPSAFPAPFDKLTVPDGMVWKYETTLRDGRVYHTWSLSNDAGAIHISAWLCEYQGRHEWLGGIECHWPSPPEYMASEKPSHEHCWVLGKPCWHDGTSLGFSETVADMLPPPYEPEAVHVMQTRHHAYVTRVLLRWHYDKFASQSTQKADPA